MIVSSMWTWTYLIGCCSVSLDVDFPTLALNQHEQVLQCDELKLRRPDNHFSLSSALCFVFLLKNHWETHIN